MTIDFSERIPNNVGLADDQRLLRALERWQPRFVDWWQELGPSVFQANDVYLRTAVDIGQEGWAHFGYVKMPEYRWGIFLSPPLPDRTIGFGEHLGEPVWQEVPGEYRADLRRLVVVQGDTEPASVEQQRHLGRTAPSLYDLRNLFQINVEEGRHLWAMVYLLHAHFGRDGRDEADAMLERHSGDPDRPRILGAFNEPTTDWLSYFLFTYFTDRDGKFQLASLRESGFDPLSRTCDFMLKEEAHHMFVGASGVARVVERTASLMREHDTDDVAPYGGINISTVQRYLNFHYTISLDLFGGEVSTNAANYYTAGLKGRYQEPLRDDDHRLDGAFTTVAVPDGDGSASASASASATAASASASAASASASASASAEVPMLTALNADLRRDYIADCAKGVARWNRLLAGTGLALRLPHEGFNRRVGMFAGHHVTPDGERVSAAAWEAGATSWLPTDADRAHVASLMHPVYEPGRFAGWVAPPSAGINARPIEFAYVRL